MLDGPWMDRPAGRAVGAGRWPTNQSIGRLAHRPGRVADPPRNFTTESLVNLHNDGAKLVWRAYLSLSPMEGGMGSVRWGLGKLGAAM